MAPEKIKWIIILVAIFFLTIKIALFITSVKERFVKQVEDLFMMQDMWYKDMFASVFQPFLWNSYINGQDDESETLLKVWSTEPAAYGIYVSFHKNLDCDTLVAPFILAKFYRQFKNGMGCIIVVDKSKLNRPDLIFFMDSITPSLNRSSVTETEQIQNDVVLLHEQGKMSGQQMLLKLDARSVMSHYFITIEKAPFPLEWSVYGVESNRKELINKYKFSDWRLLGQRMRFDCFSGVGYSSYLFEFDTSIGGIKLQMWGRPHTA